jgi:hypothetical protein
MEDAEHSQVSAAAMARIHEINALEESSAVKIADLDGVEKDESTHTIPKLHGTGVRP